VFAWQRGYGALSVGERQRPIAEAYVADQKGHHQRQTTNLWLERDAELDEGPPDAGIAPQPVPGIARERQVAYGDWAEPPF